MRLGILFLLVTLALCCHQANAVVCPSLPHEFLHFLENNKLLYKMLLQSYNPPPEAIAAKMELKKCTDQITFKHKLLFAKILIKIVAVCNFETSS